VDSDKCQLGDWYPRVFLGSWCVSLVDLHGQENNDNEVFDEVTIFYINAIIQLDNWNRKGILNYDGEQSKSTQMQHPIWRSISATLSTYTVQQGDNVHVHRDY